MRAGVLGDDVIEWFILPEGVGHQVVEVGDVGLVVFSVVILEGLRGQLVREGLQVVGQLR